MHLAAQHGHVDVINLLCNNFFGLLHIRDFMGQQAMHVAAAVGHTIVIDTLVSLELEAMESDRGLAQYDGVSLVVEEDARHGDDTSKGSDGNGQGNTGSYIRDRSVVTKGHGDNMNWGAEKKKTKHSKLINAKDKFGRTPMHLAAQNGYPECIHLLAVLRANLEIREAAFNDTPLQASVRLGVVDCIRALIQHGANVQTYLDTTGATYTDEMQCED